MALSTADHQRVHRQVKDARNSGARYRLAQQRGQELAALRKEVATLRGEKAALERRLQDALWTLERCACGLPPGQN